ncbi:hypothetical protein [Brevundimonas sp. MEB006b]|uniref:hypothetical protein n=1 Tax=Brevundimonas sp. MEB006b TaxID=3040283 RepID=UPI00254AE6F8|nr:hypothetical protein [Brevundimonas sp. MEB006b]
MTEDGGDHRRFWSRSTPLRALTQEERDAALGHLKDRAVGRMAAHHLALEMQAGQERAHHGDPDAARDYLELVRALRQGGRITYAEYVLQVGSRMEMVSDHRWFQGAYTADLQPISDAMDRITQSHGLSREEYWPRGEEPEDYRVLSDAYSACLNAKLIETMREFGEQELADLREREPARYDALREEGRRSVFEKENRLTALTTLIDYYEHEADAAGNAGAYLAGCLMWGAAAEGRLLLWCLRAPALAEQARQALPSKSRPKKPDPADWTLDGLVQVAHGAGWIGVLEDDDFVFIVEGLLQSLRQSRNLIHPGRSLQLEPHLRRDKTAFDDAKAAYAVLRINEVAHAPQPPDDLSS